MNPLHAPRELTLTVPLPPAGLGPNGVPDQVFDPLTRRWRSVTRRLSRHERTAIKRDYQEQVTAAVWERYGTRPPRLRAATMHLLYVLPTARRDLDNLIAASKALIDCLVKVHHIIPDDGPLFLRALCATWEIDPRDPAGRTVITFSETTPAGVPGKRKGASRAAVL